MWFDKLEDSLPNGFHDAILQKISIDYLSCKAELRLGVDVSDCETMQEPVYRTVLLKVDGFHNVKIEEPNGNDFEPEEEITISDSGIDSAFESKSKKGYYFFLSQLNAFLKIYGDSVDIEYLD